ncbi:MAG: hypothetical protein GVY23_06115 [Spirochaetes bacterium]|nr:hypothetical protein [Spirochaetota bacterium]
MARSIAEFVLALALLCGVPIAAASANEHAALRPELRSSSGSPLLLEVILEDPPPKLEEIVVRTGSSELRFDATGLGTGRAAEAGTAAEDPSAAEEGPTAEDPADRDPLVLTLTPFLEPGVYDLEIELRGERFREVATFEVGFVDFVWGRDNFRFGNNADYESRVGDYSRVLSDWLEKRFGSVSDAERALLVHYMYGLFGENPGRCYAFTGSQLRYYRNPDTRPSYVDKTYDIRMRSTRSQREMHELQLDMVYDHFVAGGAPVEGRQSLLEVARELAHIRERIVDGSPVVTGFISPALHHAMLAHGYILDRERGRVDLLVANNWKSGQDLNLRSVDAEVIRIDLNAAEAGTEEAEADELIEWRTREGPRRRSPQRMFIVPVRESYDHARQPLEGLLAASFAELRAARRRIITVENVEAAWIAGPDGRSVGYRENRTRTELDSVTFDRLKQTMLFEFPEGEDLTLGIVPVDGEEARLFYAGAGAVAGPDADADTSPGAERGWITTVETVEAEDREASRVRLLRLGPDGPSFLER